MGAQHPFVRAHAQERADPIGRRSRGRLMAMAPVRRLCRPTTGGSRASGAGGSGRGAAVAGSTCVGRREEAARLQQERRDGAGGEPGRDREAATCDTGSGCHDAGRCTAQRGRDGVGRRGRRRALMRGRSTEATTRAEAAGAAGARSSGRSRGHGGHGRCVAGAGGASHGGGRTRRRRCGDIRNRSRERARPEPGSSPTLQGRGAARLVGAIEEEDVDE